MYAIQSDPPIKHRMPIIFASFRILCSFLYYIHYKEIDVCNATHIFEASVKWCASACQCVLCALLYLCNKSICIIGK